jgi:phosphatidylserine/phosphatidylglycerophosphate/cardiolipin synthase-like enzyme
MRDLLFGWAIPLVGGVLSFVPMPLAGAEEALSDSAGDPPLGTLEFVESVPVETELDLPDIRDTPEVWSEMLESARSRIDVAAFYISPRTNGSGALRPILGQLESAVRRGVRLRTLVDAGFYRKYPEIPDRLGTLSGAETRLLDARALWGGSLHTKCMIVDGKQFFLGSQNWDWRALEHIHELGVRVRDEGLTTSLQGVFDLDWALASKGAEPPESNAIAGGEGSPPPATEGDPGAERRRVPLLHLASGDTVSVVLGASPARALPGGVPWDEPLLVDLMDSARESLLVHLLSYRPVDRSGEYYEVLENALRRAAARDVRVRIILANWSKRPELAPHIQSLAAVPNIEIRFTNIPGWSGGFIPYARVEHPKYLVADGTACWIGTANWARSYFHRSRNVSLFVYGEAATADVVAFFEGSWNSPYAEVVTPCGTYDPPPIGEAPSPR